MKTVAGAIPILAGAILAAGAIVGQEVSLAHGRLDPLKQISQNRPVLLHN